jgi:hypothetical protein
MEAEKNFQAGIFAAKFATRLASDLPAPRSSSRCTTCTPPPPRGGAPTVGTSSWAYQTRAAPTS